MTAKRQDFPMFAGDTAELLVTVADGNAEPDAYGEKPPANLTGSTIKWALKDSVAGMQKVLKTVGVGVSLTAPWKGEFSVLLSPADTQGLVGRFYHEAEVTDIDGHVSTVLTGFIRIEPSGV